MGSRAHCGPPGSRQKDSRARSLLPAASTDVSSRHTFVSVSRLPQPLHWTSCLNFVISRLGYFLFLGLTFVFTNHLVLASCLLDRPEFSAFHFSFLRVPWWWRPAGAQRVHRADTLIQAHTVLFPGTNRERRTKTAYRHPDYLTYTQSTSCKMPGGMKHKLESRLLGEIPITSSMQMTHPYGRQ